MEEELDLFELFITFWKKKYWIILAVIVGIILAVVYTKFIITPKYMSSVTLILSKPENTTSFTTNDAITQSDITLNQKLISTYSEILKSKRVGKTVLDNLKVDMDYNELKEGVSVNSVKDTDVIKVSVTTYDAELSKVIVSEMVKVFTDEVDRIYSIKNVSIVDEAEIDLKPVNVSLLKNIVIFALIGFVLACGVIFLIFYFDNTVKSSEQINSLTELPVLAVIPKINLKKEYKKDNILNGKKEA